MISSLAFVALIAQVLPTPGLRADEPFSVLFTHSATYQQPDGVPCGGPDPNCVIDTTQIDLRIDGGVAQSVQWPMAETSFYVAAGLPVGSHSVLVQSIGPGGTGSAPLVSFDIIVAPSPQGPPTFTHGAPAAQCADGLDNDKDGLIDLADPGCVNASDNDETNTTAPLTIAVATPWAQAGSGNVTTTATPTTAGDLLVAAIAADTGGAAPTITLTSVPALTWTQRIASGGSNTSQVRLYTAVATGATTTATIAVPGSSARALQLYKVTGYNTAQPIGVTWSGTSSTNNWTASTYVSSTAGSIGMAVASDWAALGAPSSTDLGQPSHLQVTGTSLSWIAVRKAAPTATAGTSVSFNVDAAGGGTPAWRAVAMELRPQ